MESPVPELWLYLCFVMSLIVPSSLDIRAVFVLSWNENGYIGKAFKILGNLVALGARIRARFLSWPYSVNSAVVAQAPRSPPTAALSGFTTSHPILLQRRSSSQFFWDDEFSYRGSWNSFWIRKGLQAHRRCPDVLSPGKVGSLDIAGPV